MFPSESYKELCIENQKALEWEPKIGDFFTYYDNKYKTIRFDCLYSGDMGDGWTPLAGHTWLPRLDQLIGMLEDRGYDWLIESKALIGKEGRYEAVLFGLCTKPSTKIKLRAEGPDPATALLKAYLEVKGK